MERVLHAGLTVTFNLCASQLPPVVIRTMKGILPQTKVFYKSVPVP